MTQHSKNVSLHQAGMTLIEILVGLVIGLLATLVIMQVFSVFEGQKRSTSGNADAQTNGNIALHNIQRDVQMAGFGLPPPAALEAEVVGGVNNTSLDCNKFPDYINPATLKPTNIFPLVIQDGGANANDTITVRYSTTAMGAVPVNIVDPANATSAAGLVVDNNIGCKNNDIVLISSGSSCVMTSVANANGNPATTKNISLDAKTPLGGPIVSKAKLACMGNWQNYTYQIVNNELQLNGSPIVAGVVNMQAQYGVSATAQSNQVNQWVDAAGVWADPAVVDRNRIKAIRVVVVLRNGLLEKTTVTTPCTTVKGTVNNGPCAWDDTDYSAAPMIDLSANADWDKYRYRAFDTIIPLRNMIWSGGVL